MKKNRLEKILSFMVYVMLISFVMFAVLFTLNIIFGWSMDISIGTMGFTTIDIYKVSLKIFYRIFFTLIIFFIGENHGKDKTKWDIFLEIKESKEGKKVYWAEDFLLNWIKNYKKELGA